MLIVERSNVFLLYIAYLPLLKLTTFCHWEIVTFSVILAAESKMYCCKLYYKNFVVLSIICSTLTNWLLYRTLCCIKLSVKNFVYCKENYAVHNCTEGNWLCVFVL